MFITLIRRPNPCLQSAKAMICSSLRYPRSNRKPSLFIPGQTLDAITRGISTIKYLTGIQTVFQSPAASTGHSGLIRHPTRNRQLQRADTAGPGQNEIFKLRSRSVLGRMGPCRLLACCSFKPLTLPPFECKGRAPHSGEEVFALVFILAVEFN